jgi:hypothetical protein
MAAARIPLGSAPTGQWSGGGGLWRATAAAARTPLGSVPTGQWSGDGGLCRATAAASHVALAGGVDGGHPTCADPARKVCLSIELVLSIISADQSSRAKLEQIRGGGLLL